MLFWNSNGLGPEATLVGGALMTLLITFISCAIIGFSLYRRYDNVIWI